MKQSNNINEILKSVEFNDKAWLFFKKNNKLIFIVTGFFIVMLLAFGVNRLCLERSVQKMQKAYSAISTTEDKINFAKKYGQHKLAGIVFLSLGDSYFSLEKYDLAKTAYGSASKILKSTVLAPRVKTNLAIATYKEGSLSETENILNEVLHNEDYDKSFRSNACYMLAEILKDSGNIEKLKDFVKRIETMDLTDGFLHAITELATKD